VIEIVPSILAADYLRLGEQIDELEAAGFTALHIDMMDGQFVPDLSFGPDLVRAIHSVTSMRLDVHLMTLKPERYLDELSKAGADVIIIHQETCPHLMRILCTIKDFGMEAGVTLNPGTPLCMIEEVLDISDRVQVMTVNPGWGGQRYLPSQTRKIKRLKQQIQQRSLKTPISVDGGVNEKTVQDAVKAGASSLVVGSGILNNQKTIQENLVALTIIAEQDVAHIA